MSARNEEIASALPQDLDTLPRRDGFRLRGLQMTRLESFVDATFAFAITVLVIAGERAPDDVDAVLGAFRNVPAFAASIAVLAIFWRGHWLWSRRFGLEDGVSIALSWAMIFTMLIYVYPLKVIFAGMFYAISGGGIGHRIGLHTLANAREFFAIYALGFVFISLEILLLNWRGWHLREPLRLDARERLTAIGEITGWAVPVLVGTISLTFALVLPERLIEWSAWVYFAMTLLVPLHARWRRRAIERLD